MGEMKRAIARTVMIVLVFGVGCLGGGSYKVVAMSHYTEQRNGHRPEPRSRRGKVRQPV
jgi:hypothetical protein